MVDWTLIALGAIGAVPTTITASALLVSAWHNGRKIDSVEKKVDIGVEKADAVSQQITEAADRNLAMTAAVHEEVKTLNGQTMAEIIEQGEDRRKASL